jgi:hypothetical protein
MRGAVLVCMAVGLAASACAPASTARSASPTPKANPSASPTASTTAAEPCMPQQTAIPSDASMDSKGDVVSQGKVIVPAEVAGALTALGWSYIGGIAVPACSVFEVPSTVTVVNDAGSAGVSDAEATAIGDAYIRTDQFLEWEFAVGDVGGVDYAPDVVFNWYWSGAESQALGAGDSIVFQPTAGCGVTDKVTIVSVDASTLSALTSKYGGSLPGYSGVYTPPVAWPIADYDAPSCQEIAESGGQPVGVVETDPPAQVFNGGQLVSTGAGDLWAYDGPRLTCQGQYAEPLIGQVCQEAGY